MLYVTRMFKHFVEVMSKTIQKAPLKGATIRHRSQFLSVRFLFNKSVHCDSAGLYKWDGCFNV